MKNRGRLGIRGMGRIDRAEVTTALDDESGNGSMDETRGQLAVRRIDFEIPSLVHIIQEICDGDRFLLAEKGDVNRSEDGRQTDRGARIRIGKRSCQVD